MEKSFWKELWLLLLFTAVGLLPCVVISVLALMFHTESAIPTHVAQWAQTIFVMILPPIFWYIFRVKGDPFAGFGMKRTDWRATFLAVLFVVCSIPAFECINYLCNNIPLPQALREMADQMAKMNAQVMEQMLSLDGFFGWMELILLMSIATAIGEELMFRGALLKCFSFTRLNRHWQAVLVGLIFSAIHFEPIGFFDRWILGTLLCYFVFWSGSLWPSIILHATNNLVALIQYKCLGMVMPNESPEMSFSWPLVVMSFLAAGLILVAASRVRSTK